MMDSQAAIHICRTAEGYAIGLAMFEPYGLKGWLCEIESLPSHPYSAVDQLLHLLWIGNGKRLMISASSKEAFDEIESNFAMYEYTYESRHFESDEQNRLFEQCFNLRSLLSPIEHLSLENKPLCAQALALMAHTLCKNDVRLMFAPPELLETDALLKLGNNALEQLEITSSDARLATISKRLLNMSTSVGKRLGRFRLFLPIKEAAELNRRFDWIEVLNPHALWLRGKLQEMGDIELFWWQIQNRMHAGYDPFRHAIGIVIEIQRFCVQHKLLSTLPSATLLDGWEIEFKNNGYHRQWLQEQLFLMRETIDWIAQIDVAVTSAINAQQYGLIRPLIIESSDNFLQMSALRHLLVESQGIAYVPNDIVMGNRDYLDLPYPETVMLDSKVHDGATVRGVLLYGINSSGKSSLMKSIGIAVTLAQSGFFVPAKSMKFSLYDGVYTRIQSRDNVAKSLSTFGVEMLELNTIFSQATSRSLVLGDEISHGTETLSAVSIVASTIMELSQKGCLFLMTTHLHQLSMISELSRLREVVHLHLSVRYDEEKDRLIYDRILKAGRGSSVYGLEFAESLHMNPRFLRNASRLRENLAKEYDVLELGNQKEYIKRYREVVACECVICGALIRNAQKNIHAKEHHHLIPLCETHTRDVSQGKIKLQGFIMTTQGLRLEYETQLKEE